jgi:hypothetical protein
MMNLTPYLRQGFKKGGDESGRTVVSKTFQSNNGKSCDVSWELCLEPGEKRIENYVYGKHIWVYNRCIPKCSESKKSCALAAFQVGFISILSSKASRHFLVEQAEQKIDLRSFEEGRIQANYIYFIFQSVV